MLISCFNNLRSISIKTLSSLKYCFTFLLLISVVILPSHKYCFYFSVTFQFQSLVCGGENYASASGDFSDMAELTKDIVEGGKEGKREKKVKILQGCEYI